MDNSLLIGMPGGSTGPGPGLRGGSSSRGFVQRIAQQGGGLFVRGASGSWAACRLPPRRGSSPYLEVLVSGEVGLWFNDGQGSYRLIRSPASGSAPAAMCAARSTLRQWSSGHSELVDHVLEVDPD
jgi:hypothetical protein